MAHDVTLLLPEPPSSKGSRLTTSTLPPDLLAQVRGRVQLLAGLILLASVVDPLFFVIGVAIAAVRNVPLPADYIRSIGFQYANLATLALSAGLWWAARSPRVSSSRLIQLGLAYEVLVCAHIAVTTNWQQFRESGTLPNLTWVPALVILFPLVLPGPPRLMLWGAIASAAMPPLALLVLERMGAVRADLNNYLQAIVSAVVAVSFAVMGARVIYRLGRELVAARELGCYRLEEKLGEGGMGEVWRARHRLLARPAAIKLIRNQAPHGPADVPDEAIRRFEREAQATATLRSPHTVNLYDFGVAQDGAFYYVMELLDGLDAGALINRFGPLPAARAVYLLKQVCHSLSEAESVGLVHRDIKPPNVYVCRYGEEHDYVKVLDFGLVKALSAPRSEPRLTGANVIEGTPAFMAPEQVLGSDDLDGRVDIYATGCLAYWLLTGKVVFDDPSALAVFYHHANTVPAPPSSRTEMPIPESLDRLVLACLEKDPARRPQTARELAHRLAETVDPAAWTEEQAKHWWTANRPA